LVQKATRPSVENLIFFAAREASEPDQRRPRRDRLVRRRLLATAMDRSAPVPTFGAGQASSFCLRIAVIHFIEKRAAGNRMAIQSGRILPAAPSFPPKFGMAAICDRITLSAFVAQ
jgi:hypothetical protein